MEDAYHVHFKLMRRLSSFLELIWEVSPISPFLELIWEVSPISPIFPCRPVAFMIKVAGNMTRKETYLL